VGTEHLEERRRRREARRAERARRRAERRSGERPRDGSPKERVLHTRISQQLSEDIRRVADDLRVPVSNLVRNVLEEAFSVVETVSQNVGDLLEDILDEAEEARDRYRARGERWEGEAPPPEPSAPPAPPAEAARARPEFPEVLAWQPVLLNRDAVCADCAAPIPRGARAAVGIGSQGAPTAVVLCLACTDARS
jgi:hypothetical protein